MLKILTHVSMDEPDEGMNAQHFEAFSTSRTEKDIKGVLDKYLASSYCWSIQSQYQTIIDGN